MSFKRKLVLYFVVLTFLPLAAAFVTFQSALEHREVAIVDARLDAALRSGTAAYRQELAEAQREAVRLARSRTFQRALAGRDRVRLEQLLARSPHLRIEAGTLRLGASTADAVLRRVSVVSTGPLRRLGSVVAVVPLDDAFAASLTSRTGSTHGERMVVIRRGRVVAGARDLLGLRLETQPGRAVTVDTPRGAFRVLAAAGPPSLAAIAPEEGIEGAVDSARQRLLLAFAIALLLVGIVAYLEGRAIVRAVHDLVAAAGSIAGGRLTRRVQVRGRDELAQLGHAFNDMVAQLEARREELEAERRRVRRATLRLGQVFSATHDVDLLRSTIVETAVEATSAAGGAFLTPTGEVARSGELDGDDRIELPVTAGRESFGTLVLSGTDFASEDVDTASLLVGQAAVALENARLHHMVEQQALIDSLTGLPNRRRAEEALAAELARADRYGSPIAVVLADLDDFKAVNDAHGHESGDAVLRLLAGVLRENLREVDLAARWGGEEFLLLLPDTDSQGALIVAERVRSVLAGRAVHIADGNAVRVTTSCGVAAYPPASSREELLTAADAALYGAKRQGKNRVEIADGAHAVQPTD